MLVTRLVARLGMVKKKLRDVLQKREGATFTKFEQFEAFWSILKYTKPLSHSILVYRGISRSISVYFGLSWSISWYLGLSQSILVNLGLSWFISDYHDLSQTILDYLRISPTNSDYLGLFLTILEYLGLSRSFSDNLWLSRTILDFLGSSWTNKIFDPSTPSMRKGRDGGEKKKGKQAVAELCQAQA